MSTIKIGDKIIHILICLSINLLAIYSYVYMISNTSMNNTEIKIELNYKIYMRYSK